MKRSRRVVEDSQSSETMTFQQSTLSLSSSSSLSLSVSPPRASQRQATSQKMSQNSLRRPRFQRKQTSVKRYPFPMTLAPNLDMIRDKTKSRLTSWMTERPSILILSGVAGGGKRSALRALAPSAGMRIMHPDISSMVAEHGWADSHAL
ncbi:hypothetical protein KIPB_002771 [Kipferlia bialata]|uniref:Uncharacterized protein n=1 Tax=Kipferlia bialata TaxID=797122 RepID=A0A9K3CTD2_9EUKA|nr:hypothetical protein KIPB_002771 [Kipferlia bialata]|eukprot:g2771.t1